MKIFTKILVHITDPAADKRMLEKAVEIAQRNNAKIAIIGVTRERITAYTLNTHSRVAYSYAAPL